MYCVISVILDRNELEQDFVGGIRNRVESVCLEFWCVATPES